MPAATDGLGLQPDADHFDAEEFIRLSGRPTQVIMRYTLNGTELKHENVAAENTQSTDPSPSRHHGSNLS